MPHLMTNRGKLKLAQGKWDTAGATLVRVGLLVTSIPTAIDTAAEVADLNVVQDLFTAGAVECTAGGYARQNLTRSVAGEVDGSDWVNLDASDVSFGALAGSQLLVASFYYIADTDTSDSTRELLSLDIWASSLTTNGSNISIPITDLYRLS